MQAIEFETCLDNGLIHLPLSYQYWQSGKTVKVIILSNEETSNKIPQDINRYAGTISLTQDPLEFQNMIRDEWT